MARKITCVLLGPDSEGLDRPPYPGALGQRIYENVSKLAWQRWVKHQTMLLNEYRLTPIEPKARKFLEDEMQKFFFGGAPTRRRTSSRRSKASGARAAASHMAPGSVARERCR